MPQFNGQATIWHDDKSDYDEMLATDACPEGAGAVSQGHYFHSRFPKAWDQYNIACFELATIMVSLKLWGNNFTSKKIKILCDNTAAVSCITYGRSNIPINATVLVRNCIH